MSKYTRCPRCGTDLSLEAHQKQVAREQAIAQTHQILDKLELLIRDLRVALGIRPGAPLTWSR